MGAGGPPGQAGLELGADTSREAQAALAQQSLCRPRQAASVRPKTGAEPSQLDSEAGER